MGSAINTNLQGSKSTHLLVQLIPSLYFSRISMRLGVSHEGSSPQPDGQRSRVLPAPFSRPGQGELMGMAKVRAAA